jgi:hypothetical protein
MTNTPSPPFKRLILRAVLNDMSPIVARVFSIPDDVEITELHDVFLSMDQQAHLNSYQTCLITVLIAGG